jgi:hypothetical protein
MEAGAERQQGGARDVAGRSEGDVSGALRAVCW